MKTEKEKMMTGELYDPIVPELLQKRRWARVLFQRLNNTHPDEQELCQQLLKELLGKCGKHSRIEPPFHCDYGDNITLGDRVFINFDCIFLDVYSIVIGNDILIGPKVQLYTAAHSTNLEPNHTRGCFGKPIVIGDHCWLGGGVIVCPGVSIGDRYVVGAGSVVTRNIPKESLAVGNPARIIRKFNPIDNLVMKESYS
jgi:maltose O-acetyltransferase